MGKNTEKAVTRFERQTYLQELKLVTASERLQESDASNAVRRSIDSQEVAQIADRFNVTKIVALEVQVLQVLVLLQAITKIAHLRIISVLHGQGRESVRASICITLSEKIGLISMNIALTMTFLIAAYRGCAGCVKDLFAIAQA